MRAILVAFFISFSATYLYAVELITNTTENVCTTDYLAYRDGHDTVLHAVFQPNAYDCGVGYFLPANGIECAPCPVEHSCPGGTYTFNENYAQGIVYSDYVTQDANNLCAPDFIAKSDARMFAVFKINTYDCGAGYYLPADGIECAPCDVGHYCVGGTYAYNESMAQGISACPDGLFSPMGMWDVSQCGRKLHVGDDVVYLHSVKKTTPSLNVDMNGDGVADFWGNMSKIPTNMSRNSTHKLKVLYNGVIMYVHDDTVTPE